jgi:hypothetical protein
MTMVQRMDIFDPLPRGTPEDVRAVAFNSDLRPG